MAHTVEELNYSGKRLVVDSIEVINNIEGQQLTTIKSNVDAMQQQVAGYNSQQRNYWTALSDDGKITPAEKKTLQREWIQIQETYERLEEEATTRGIQDQSIFNTYETMYGALDTLLNTTYKIFENMTVVTSITDRENFDKAFAHYYSYENYCQMALSDKNSNDYWDKLSEDQYISPAEKKTLLNQIKGIKATYDGYVAQAESKGLVTHAFFIDYQNTYNALYNYLYNELQLFNRMTDTEVIEDRDVFNQYFQDYYEAEANLNITFNAAIIDTAGIKVLESLDDPGVADEVAVYRGSWYQYIVDSAGHGMWTPLGVDNFAGVLSELPTTEVENMYFMAAEDFIVSTPLYITKAGEYLGLTVNTLSEQDVALYVNYKYESGFIYVYQNSVWTKLSNKSDAKYMQAMLEYFNVTGELPGVFKDTINSAVDKAINDNNVVRYIPKYLHKSPVDPANANDGDWYCYSGATTQYRKKSYLYKKIDGVWTEMSPTDTASNGTDYMGALDDILSLNEKSTGYFASIFLEALYGHSLFADLLNTFNIVLRTIDGKTGSIQSDNYEAGVAGLFLGANGKAELQDAIVRGAIKATSLILEEGVTIAGSKISGKVDNAINADSASSATNASYASSAGSATTADTADSATDATNLSNGTMTNILLDHNSNEVALATDDFYSSQGHSGFCILKNGSVFFNNGYFRGDITGASGTFGGDVEAQSFTINLLPGSLTIASFEAYYEGSVGFKWGKSAYMPAHGTVKILLQMSDNSTAGEDNTTYYFYHNDYIEKTFTFRKNTGIHSEFFEIDVEENDKLSLVFGTNAGGRTSNAKMTCYIQASRTNPIIQTLLRANIEEWTE